MSKSFFPEINISTVYKDLKTRLNFQWLGGEQSQNKIIPYWALAEEEAVNLKKWQNFNPIWTGNGDLGLRLHNIYNHLQKKYEYVILIGTDSPQITPEIIINSIDKRKIGTYIDNFYKDKFNIFKNKITLEN